MKKVILTISALLVSAAMVFSFAGCTDKPSNEDESNTNNVGAGVVADEDSTNA